MKTIDEMFLWMWDQFEDWFCIGVTLYFGFALAYPGAFMLFMY